MVYTLCNCMGSPVKGGGDKNMWKGENAKMGINKNLNVFPLLVGKIGGGGEWNFFGYRGKKNKSCAEYTFCLIII